MQVLLINMNDDLEWDNTSKSHDPSTLLNLSNNTVLAQMEDQYGYAIVYGQECSLYGFRQHTLTNKQYCQCFNTKVDVGILIFITIQHCDLMEGTAQETLKSYSDDCETDEQL